MGKSGLVKVSCGSADDVATWYLGRIWVGIQQLAQENVLCCSESIFGGIYSAGYGCEGSASVVHGWPLIRWTHKTESLLSNIMMGLNPGYPF